MVIIYFLIFESRSFKKHYFCNLKKKTLYAWYLPADEGGIG